VAAAIFRFDRETQPTVPVPDDFNFLHILYDVGISVENDSKPFFRDSCRTTSNESET
jgi:hypothetical protein